MSTTQLRRGAPAMLEDGCSVAGREPSTSTTHRRLRWSPRNHKAWQAVSRHEPSTSTTQRKPVLPVELSGVFWLRAATRYRLQYDL